MPNEKIGQKILNKIKVYAGVSFVETNFNYQDASGKDGKETNKNLIASNITRTYLNADDTLNVKKVINIFHTLVNGVAMVKQGLSSIIEKSHPGMKPQESTLRTKIVKSIVQAVLLPIELPLNLLKDASDIAINVVGKIIEKASKLLINSKPKPSTIEMLSTSPVSKSKVLSSQGKGEVKGVAVDHPIEPSLKSKAKEVKESIKSSKDSRTGHIPVKNNALKNKKEGHNF